MFLYLIISITISEITLDYLIVYIESRVHNMSVAMLVSVDPIYHPIYHSIIHFEF